MPEYPEEMTCICGCLSCSTDCWNGPAGARRIAMQDWGGNDWIYRSGGPYDSSRVVMDILCKIKTLTRLMSLPEEERKSISGWVNDFFRALKGLLFSWKITAAIYAFDAGLEMPEVNLDEMLGLRFQSCYPLMQEMTECLNQASKCLQTISYFSFPLGETLKKKSLQQILSWWDEILVKNQGIYPVQPLMRIPLIEPAKAGGAGAPKSLKILMQEEEIKSLMDASSRDRWERFNQTLVIYIADVKAGKDPLAYLRDYL